MTTEAFIGPDLGALPVECRVARREAHPRRYEVLELMGAL